MIDPRECTHVFEYDAPTHVVYCPLCMWWWDSDYETPTREARPQYQDQPASEAQPADTAMNNAMNNAMLNPDNEPTSEHMQWSDDDDDI